MELITLVLLEMEVDSSTEDVDCVLDEITGSDERLEVALLTGPEQAEISKAKRSDKCFFIN